MVYVVEFKLKPECAEGPLEKVYLKRQSPPTAQSLLNNAADGWQGICSSILTSTAMPTTGIDLNLFLSRLIGLHSTLRGCV